MRDVGRKLRLRDNESGIVELTSRCIQGRFLMRPSPIVNDRILGIIGRAQRMTQIRLHAFVYLSNHDHGLCGTDSVQQMSAFKGFVNGNIARELGREHDWKEKFWGRRYHSASVADTEQDQQKRLRYILSNGCKEGLVDSPLDWPGVSSAWALSRGIWTLEGTWIDRSSDRNNGPKRVKETVQLSPMPFMESWTPKEQRQWFVDTIREIEEETRATRRKERRRSLGIKRIERQNPHDKPESFEHSPAPLFHATDADERHKLEYAREMKEAQYRYAAQRLKHGQTDAEFPSDCFLPPHVAHKRGPP